MGGEEPGGSGQEPGTGDGLLVGQHLGIGKAGVVIDGGMDKVVAGPTPSVPGPVLG